MTAEASRHLPLERQRRWMKVLDDRKVFAPLRWAEMISPELKLVALLTRHQAGATAETLAAISAVAKWWSGAGGPGPRRAVSDRSRRLTRKHVT
jgi:hypothetical protein